MRANLYATFRLIAGVKSIDLDLPPDVSIHEAVCALAAAYPVLQKHWLDGQGELYPHVHVFLNGHALETLAEGLAARVQPGDTLDFFPPVAGGSGQGELETVHNCVIYPNIVLK
jgi:molybdopterin synthase sulfur carrier subunit